MTNRSAAACGLFLLAFTHHLASQTSSPTAADLVVFGHIWTGDSSRPWVQAVSVVGDTITALGDSTWIASAIGPKTRVLANGKDMVVPGFMDGHVHFLSGGFQLASVELRDADSPAEFTRRLKRYAAKLRPGEWILGGDWDHERWPGSPLPDRSWIDSVTPKNPVFVSRLDGHMALANSAALNWPVSPEPAETFPAAPSSEGRMVSRPASSKTRPRIRCMRSSRHPRPLNPMQL